MGNSNPYFHTLKNASCNFNLNRSNSTSYQCHRIDYCSKIGSSDLYSHVIEASCVPTDQCSSLLCNRTTLGEAKQSSCQATCCTSDYCSNTFVNNNDFSCEADTPGSILFNIWILLCLAYPLALICSNILKILDKFTSKSRWLNF